MPFPRSRARHRRWRWNRVQLTLHHTTCSGGRQVEISTPTQKRQRGGSFLHSIFAFHHVAWLSDMVYMRIVYLKSNINRLRKRLNYKLLALILVGSNKGDDNRDQVPKYCTRMIRRNKPRWAISCFAVIPDCHRRKSWIFVDGGPNSFSSSNCMPIESIYGSESGFCCH